MIPKELSDYFRDGTLTEVGERSYRYEDDEGNTFAIEWGMGGRWIIKREQ